PLTLELSDAETGRSLRAGLFRVSARSLTLGPSEKGGVEFHWADGRGLSSTRRLDFSGDVYTIQASASVRFQGAEVAKKVLFGPGLGEESAEGTYVQKEKGVIQAGGELRLYTAEDIEEQVSPPVEAQAVGVASHYFAGLMIAPEPAGYGPLLRRKTMEVGEGKKQKRDFVTAALVMPAEPRGFTLFVGPKDRELMAGLKPGLEKIVDIEFGEWLHHIVLPLRAALLWTEHKVGNYGWAIALLTLAINVALSPLKHYSYVSMRKMQKLAPQIKRIQERYKKLKPTDPRRRDMNTEVLALYREHKVSPFSGCLPMLLMIPFFFAFYRLMLVSIEFRHAPFLWVRDLSSHDPYFLLPILMGASQLAIQVMTPQTT
ncbi:MAG: YidC/Oxa1 family insertase periplasmic-domain containing protein, partial [Acidobacteria bacterium]|nr:YidC/Oxa1 family insertase periplasmic-domain containing protein [Acidobacteriota bacterium]